MMSSNNRSPFRVVAVNSPPILTKEQTKYITFPHQKVVTPVGVKQLTKTFHDKTKYSPLPSFHFVDCTKSPSKSTKSQQKPSVEIKQKKMKIMKSVVKRVPIASPRPNKTAKIILTPNKLPNYKKH